MAKGKELKKLPISGASHLHVKATLPDYNEVKPIFSLHCMDYRKDTCLSQCGNVSKASFANTLLLLSQRTWKELLTTQKQSLGEESIPVERFKVPLPKIVTPEVRKLMVFRFSQSERMAGIRINDVYHVLVVGADLYNH